MAIVISGVNNNDKITASDGTIDLLSGVNYTGIITAPSITASNNITAGNLNIGSNIQLGNAGVATATTFVGNLTGNVNATSNLLLQIGGSEKFRVGSSGQLGIAGANYGTSGQVLSSGGSGSAATWQTIDLSNLSATNLTSGTIPDARFPATLPAVSGANLTGVGIGTDGSVNTSGIITATSFVPTTGQLSHRNIIYNGDMRVAQRGTSSTSSGIHTVDRFNVQFGGTDEAMTVEQADVASGTTPYTLGFLKCLKVTNGNQTSGAGAGDWLEIYQYLEDQDICNSGWNFKSATSYLTLSFWVKSSVSQKFAGFFYTNTAGQGDSYTYSYQIDNGSGGNLSANTWTKITHTIPGNSNLTFNNDNTKGLAVGIFPFDGTDYTTPGHTEENWQGWSSGNKLKDMDSTWWTTNDATFELTGVQLEVGPVATPFEHLSFAENKRRCGRYCQRSRFSSFAQVGTPSTYYFSRTKVPLTVPMRAAVTGTIKQATWLSNRYFAYKTWSSQTNVTTLTSASFASSHMGGSSASLDANSKTDVNSVDVSITVASGSSNAPLPANGPGSNNVYPIEIYDCLLEAEV